MGIGNKSYSDTDYEYNTDNSNVGASGESKAYRADGNIIVNDDKTVAAVFEFAGSAFDSALNSVNNAFVANIDANTDIAARSTDAVSDAFKSATQKSSPIEPNTIIYAVLGLAGLFVIMRKRTK